MNGELQSQGDENYDGIRECSVRKGDPGVILREILGRIAGQIPLEDGEIVAGGYMCYSGLIAIASRVRDSFIPFARTV